MTESPRNDESWVGRMLRGKYLVGDRIGSGGWGVVYEAEHLRLERPVAIKFLHSEIAGDEEGRERFRREALAASRIGHPNIVSVLDLDVTDDGKDFMVLERLHGQSLGELLAARTRLSPARAMGIFKQVASALGAAHGAGIIHRDLKPDNVYLVDGVAKHDFVKILDFGIAKVSPLYPDDQGSFTHAGAMLGTPSYMPPEQVRGERTLDHRADIYALGAMMYETISGVVPFSADNFPLLVMKIVEETPKPLLVRRPDVPSDLSDLVQWMLAKRPKDRPSTARAVLAALEAMTLAPSAGEGGLAAADDDEVTRIAVRSQMVAAASMGADEDEGPTELMGLPVIDAHAATSHDGRTRALRGAGARVPRPALEAPDGSATETETATKLAETPLVRAGGGCPLLPGPGPGPGPDIPSIIVSLEAFEDEVLGAAARESRPGAGRASVPPDRTLREAPVYVPEAQPRRDPTRALRRLRSRTRHGFRRADAQWSEDPWQRLLRQRWARSRAVDEPGTGSSARRRTRTAVVVAVLATLGMVFVVWAVVRVLGA